MERGKSLFLGELPLRGAAGLIERRAAVSGGAPAARGCPMAGGRSLFLGELPLHGAAGLMEGGRSLFLAKLPLHGAAGLMEGGRSLFLKEFPLRGAAGLMEGGTCFSGISHCAGLLDRGREEAASGGAPARCAGLPDGGREKPHTPPLANCIGGLHSGYATRDLSRIHIRNLKVSFCVLPSRRLFRRGAQPKIAGSCCFPPSGAQAPLHSAVETYQAENSCTQHQPTQGT